MQRKLSVFRKRRYTERKCILLLLGIKMAIMSEWNADKKWDHRIKDMEFGDLSKAT